MLILFSLSASVFAMEPPLRKITAREVCVLDKPGLFRPSKIENYIKNIMKPIKLTREKEK